MLCIVKLYIIFSIFKPQQGGTDEDEEEEEEETSGSEDESIKPHSIHQSESTTSLMSSESDATSSVSSGFSVGVKKGVRLFSSTKIIRVQLSSLVLVVIQ